MCACGHLPCARLPRKSAATPSWRANNVRPYIRCKVKTEFFDQLTIQNWGCYARATFDGIGIDRTPTGSDYAHQYAPELAEKFSNVETCPEELILFFHHLPYNYKLKSGKTVLQHIYDTHFEGAEDAARFYDQIVALKPYLDPAVYARLEARFAHQKEHSCEWRDVINTYFYRKTGVPDEKGRKIYD